ncbi:MAG TPA: polysaccharide deacetylase family protein [Rhodocyclaceae bacterium]|nr:polysaccharide deacetylase family protein [Rhodocyclaceae bacterium]
MMKALPVMMYHHVSPNPGLVTISPATFRDHIAALAKDGWRGAGLAEVEAFCQGEALPPKTCVITFDDGYLDNFVHAHPVLAEFGMKAVLFVVTGWLGDGPVRDSGAPTPNHTECKQRIVAGDADSVMVRWSEMEAMAAAGTFEFHSHTHTHTRWDREVADPAARRDALATDLERSRQTLEARLGQCSRHLCWPQGYYDPDYIRTAQGVGFDHLYTTEIRVNTAAADPLRIARFVTKERPGEWLASRTRLYSRPWLGALYSKFRG